MQKPRRAANRSPAKKDDKAIWVEFLLHDAHPNVPAKWLVSSRTDPSGETLFNELASGIWLDEGPIDLATGDDDKLSAASREKVSALLQGPLQLGKELAELSPEMLETRFRSRKDELTPGLAAMSNPELEGRIRDKYWDAYEAAAISQGLNPSILTESMCQSMVDSPLASRVLENTKTLRRAVAANDLAAAFTPQRFFRWATEYEFPINGAVRIKAAEIGFSDTVSLFEKFTIAQKRIATLEAELAESKISLKLALETEESYFKKQKSLTSLRKIAVGLAVAHHSKNKHYDTINYSAVVRKLAEMPEYVVGIDAVINRIKDAQKAVAG